MNSIDPSFKLDTAAEEQILLMASDFVERVTKSACRLAKHRNSTRLDVKDVQLILLKHYGMTIPNAPPLATPPGRVAATFSSTNPPPATNPLKRQAPSDETSEEPQLKKQAIEESNNKVSASAASAISI